VDHYSRRHVMAMRVVSLREAAYKNSARSLSTEIINFLEREETPAWYEQYQKPEIRPLHIVCRYISSKVTQILTDIMHSIEDNNKNLFNKLQLYSKSLPDS
jgi:hypothetical protein